MSADLDEKYEQLTKSYELEYGYEEDLENGEESENIKVMVRCRPLIKALRENEAKELKLDDNGKCVRLDSREFYFDQVFSQNSTNEQVYLRSVRPLVECAFKGFNCTVFLYGQTGTGKTYTHNSISSSSFAHLFSLISASKTQKRFLIRVSYYELYNEQIRDLLCESSKRLVVRESKTRGVYVKDLSSFLVSNMQELERLKQIGDQKRATASTKMNEHSSRSHSILTLTIETLDESNKSMSKSAVRVGRLNLIDLAGSERQSKSGSTGARLKEASRINLSLTCLALVIRALTDKTNAHVPYRNSKLTRLLSGSLGGNSKTLLIACVSPSKLSLDETLNTLRFASRTKLIKNKARINEDAKDALLRKYRRQVQQLRLRFRQQQEQLSKSTTIGNFEDGDDYDERTIESLANGQQQEDADGLLKQLRLLKGKIMVGGENLLEKAELHERLLLASKQELEQKKVEEAKLREKLEEKQQNIEQMEQTKGSLESQVIDLDRKLKRALELYKQTKEESKDMANEQQELKESLLQSIRATSKEIKYADCIIDDFIPKEQLELINTCARYDEESDEWQIKYIALSGNNIAQTKRISGNRDADLNVRNNYRQQPYIRLTNISPG